MTARSTIRRGATISLATIGLGALSSGIAVATTLPDPGDTVTTVQQTLTTTVNQVTGTQTTTAPSIAPTPLPTVLPTDPTSILPTASPLPTTTAAPSGSGAGSGGTTTTRQVAVRPLAGHVGAARPAGRAPSGTTSAPMADAAPALSLDTWRLPPDLTVSDPQAAPPAVAPAPQAPVTIRPAAGVTTLDALTNHRSSTLRALLLALAALAAAALGVEHVRQLRVQLPV